VSRAGSASRTPEGIPGRSRRSAGRRRWKGPGAAPRRWSGGCPSGPPRHRATVNRLLGDRITAATTQTESRTATTATPPRERHRRGPDVPAHVTLLQVPMTRPAVSQGKGGEQDQGDHHHGTGDVAVPAPQEGHPHHSPEEEAENEAAEGQDLDDGPSRRPWTAASSISPMISRSTQSTAARVSNGARGKCAPTAISHRAVLPPPCFSTGVSGGALAARSWYLVRSPSLRRAVRCRTPGFDQGRARPRRGQGHPAGSGPAGAQRDG